MYSCDATQYFMILVDLKINLFKRLPLQFLLQNSKLKNMQKRTDNFDKFGKKKGSAVKEEYRQAKKKIKAEARAAGDAMRLKKKNAKLGIVTEEPKKTNPRFPKRAPGASREEYRERKENDKRIRQSGRVVRRTLGRT